MRGCISDVEPLAGDVVLYKDIAVVLDKVGQELSNLYASQRTFDSHRDRKPE